MTYEEAVEKVRQHVQGRDKCLADMNRAGLTEHPYKVACLEWQEWKEALKAFKNGPEDAWTEGYDAGYEDGKADGYREGLNERAETHE